MASDDQSTDAAAEIARLRRVVLRLVMRDNGCAKPCVATPGWPPEMSCGCMVEADAEMIADE